MPKENRGLDKLSRGTDNSVGGVAEKGNCMKIVRTGMLLSATLVVGTGSGAVGADGGTHLQGRSERLQDNLRGC